MKKRLSLFFSLILILGMAGSASAFFVNFEDGTNGAPINNIPGVSFKSVNGYYAMYGDSRTGKYNTTSDDLGRSYNDAYFHHRGNFWLWAGIYADARGVIVDFTNNNGTWFQTGYSTYGDFILEAHLTNGATVTKSAPTNTYSSMGYLKISAPAGCYIDYVVLKGAAGNVWLVDDMSGDTTGVGNNPPPPPPPPTPNSDDDNDGMPYWWETANGLNPNANDAAGDPDGDGLSNLSEYQKGTNPKNADTDGDGMKDGWEVSIGLNPGVNDGAADSDGDGLSNLTEYQKGTSPVNADSDGDGMPDGWEVSHNLNPKANDAAGDPDGDGLINLKEYQKGTNPRNPDSDGDGMPDGWEIAYNLNPNANDAASDPDGDEMSNLEEYQNGTNPTTIPGEFRVGDTGTIAVEWLYDGGRYQGEFGIFSFSGMKPFISNPEAFITEAIRRVMSNSTQGYIVLSDPAEGARFDGSLGESTNWNSGIFNGVKNFPMTPGDTFATVLIPNSTFQALSADPMTADTNKRPLFSIVLSNLDYGMHVGQMADVNGYGKAFVWEDMDLAESDEDYNDWIVQITGAVADVTPLDLLIGQSSSGGEKRRSRKDQDEPVLFNVPDPPQWRDWRVSEALGQQIIEHVETPEVGEDSLWISLKIEGPAYLFVYDPQGRELGREGGTIPGAIFATDADGNQVVSLPALETGSYRLVLRGKGDGICNLTVTALEGNAEIGSDTREIQIADHQSLTCELSVSASAEELSFTLGETAGAALFYDFNGDGKIDDADIQKVSSRWNIAEGDAEYDAFYDVDGDGYIGILDIMSVVNSGR